MELIPGENLQQRIDRAGPLAVPEVLRIGRQGADGLAAAHAIGLIHRDVKPANVLIERGPHEAVKLTDFGLARAADDASISQSGQVTGTPMYMSPEQARGDPIDHRTDLFSLGSLLYVLTSGRPPFRAEHPLAVLRRVCEDVPRSIREIIPETPSWLCDIIARLHAKRPDDRFQSAQQVAELLARCEAKVQHQPSGPTPVPVARPPTGGRDEEGTLTLSAPEAAATPGRHEKRPGGPPRGRRALVLAAVLLLLAGGLGLTETTGVTHLRGALVRLFTPEGTLVVEADDPDVKISIDGEELVITGAGVKELRVKPGPHKVTGTRDGKVVYERLVTVEKNGKEVVRVRREGPPPAAGAARERRAAERFRDRQIEMVVAINGRQVRLPPGADLPAEPFTVLHLNLNDNVGPEAIAWLADLPHLRDAYVPPTDADRWAEALAQRPGMAIVNAFDSDLSDKGLERLARLTSLEYLSVHRCRGVTGVGLRALSACKALRKLNLDGAMLREGKYTLADLQELRRALPGLTFTRDAALPIPELSASPDRRAAEWLRSLGPVRVDVIEGGAAAYRGIEADQPLPQGPFRLFGTGIAGPQVELWGDSLAEKAAGPLEGVRLTTAYLPKYPTFTTAGLAKLLRLPAFADVTYLNISHCAADDGMFAHLAKLPNLSNLDGGSLPHVTGKGIRALAACPRLEHVALIDTPLTVEGVEELQHLPALRYLNISLVPCTEQHASALAKLQINNLVVASAGIDDAMAARLADLATLEQLSLPNNPLTDRGLAQLKNLKGLKTLDVGTTQVTAAGVADLQKALPQCKVKR